jgi:hypothetical protein
VHLLASRGAKQGAVGGVFVGLLKSFIEKLESSGAVAPSSDDDIEPLPPALAAAEAAIRQRQLADRRSPAPLSVYAGPERRSSAPDRRGRGTEFGRRTRG